MTTTDILSGQSIGTGSNTGPKLFPLKLTAQTTTSAFVVNAQLTNGAAGYSSELRPRIWYVSSPYSYAAADAPARLFTSARYLDVIPQEGAGLIAARSSQLSVLAGQYIYVWCDIPLVATAQTLTISVVEIP